ncbi:hypothetical protein, partial [uncultured Gemmiger sp.]|uniref:hypothetical protein n=1 Tax=uncultured Gemmiger sp. TaxID=1623490 RepID=UPI002618DC8E
QPYRVAPGHIGNAALRGSHNAYISLYKKGKIKDQFIVSRRHSPYKRENRPVLANIAPKS